ncbi:MAG: hypothetical protein JW846_10555 [Dehalococcoidia bacterium]|nr:hypothetical protein [Dehalococcoidia bacterium]
MKKAVRLYGAGVDRYPLRDVILSNAAMVALIVVGATACWLISPWFGIAYTLITVVMVYYVMRRLVCRNCHYFGQRCATGWGLLAAKWFTAGDIEDFNSSPGVKIAPIVYGLMVLVPLLALIVLMLDGSTTTRLMLLASLLVLALYTTVIGRRRSCSVCKMRLFCMGSAAK